MRWIILLQVILCFNLGAKENPLWILTCDTTQTNTCGYCAENGEIKIPIGKYKQCYTKVFEHIAFVKIDTTIFAITKEEQVLFEVFSENDKPDVSSEGVFRIILHKKIGYANTEGEIIIPPKYDDGLPFKDGMAFVNIGCKKNANNTIGKGGKWGAINKTGNIVIPIQYSNVNFLSHTGNEMKTPTIE